MIAVFPVFLVGMAVGVIRVRISRKSLSLSVLIPLVFSLSAFLPISSLIGLGFIRLAGIETAEKNRWRERVRVYLGDVDRRFRNFLEGLQEEYSRLSRPLIACFEKGVAPQLPFNQQYLTGILYVTTDGKTFSYKPPRMMKRKDSAEATKLIETAFQDLLQQIAPSSGQAPEAQGPAKVRLTLQDLVGDDSNLLSIFKSPGKIVFFGLDQANNLSFFQLHEKIPGRPTGLVLFLGRIDSEANIFYFWEQKRRTQAADPIHVDSRPYRNPMRPITWFRCSIATSRLWTRLLPPSREKSGN